MQASESLRGGGVVTALSALGAAALFALIWPPIGWWWCSFLTVAPLAIATLRASSTWRAFLLVVATNALAWLTLQFWLVQLTPPGMVLLVLYCSIYSGFFAILFRRVARLPAIAERRLPFALVLPILWTATEFLRTTLVLGGYPWFPVGLGLLGPESGDGLFAHGASLFGTPFLSSIAVAVSGALLDLAPQGLVPRRPPVGRAFARFVGPVIAVLAVAGELAYGLVVVRTTTTQEGPSVLVVQTDLSVSNKEAWSQADQVRDFDAFAGATLDGVERAKEARTRIDLIAWPETMVPGFGLEEGTTRMLADGGYYPGARFMNGLLGLHRATGSPLLVGAAVYLGLRANEATERWEWTTHYNSAYLVAGTLPFQRYDKLVLTPFGEVMPLISRWEWLEQKLLSLSAPGMTFDLEPGAKPVRFDIAAADGSGRRFRVVSPICFEDTIAGVCRTLCYERGKRVADAMVNLSNDGWFGWSNGGREHHVLHARIRSVELGVPMIRCANTGRSVAIEWTGRISAAIPAIGAGTGTMTQVMSPRIPDRTTLYGAVGDLWGWTMLILSAGLLVLTGRRSKA